MQAGPGPDSGQRLTRTEQENGQEDEAADADDHQQRDQNALPVARLGHADGQLLRWSVEAVVVWFGDGCSGDQLVELVEQVAGETSALKPKQQRLTSPSWSKFSFFSDMASVGWGSLRCEEDAALVSSGLAALPGSKLGQLVQAGGWQMMGFRRY